jgi:hypothetical protein
MLDDTLTGITIGRHNTKTAAVAYADVNFPEVPLDVSPIRTALDTYEKASGARITIHKSNLMAMDAWDTCERP